MFKSPTWSQTKPSTSWCLLIRSCTNHNDIDADRGPEQGMAWATSDGNKTQPGRGMTNQHITISLLSPIIRHFLEYTRPLCFDDKPDYLYLRKCFQDLFDQEGCQYDCAFDWRVLAALTLRASGLWEGSASMVSWVALWSAGSTRRTHNSGHCTDLHNSILKLPKKINKGRQQMTNRVNANANKQMRMVRMAMWAESPAQPKTSPTAERNKRSV